MLEKEDVVKVMILTDCIAVSRLVTRLGLSDEAVKAIMTKLRIYSTPCEGKMYVTIDKAREIERYSHG